MPAPRTQRSADMSECGIDGRIVKSPSIPPAETSALPARRAEPALNDDELLAIYRITARIALDCDPGPVSIACQGTFRALLRYWGLLAEGPSQSFPDDIHVAGAQFESALAIAEAEPCRSQSDVRAKCMTLELLGSLFPRDDCRIVRLRDALIQEMVQFFGMDVSETGITKSSVFCSCHADNSAADKAT